MNKAQPDQQAIEDQQIESEIEQDLAEEDMEDEAEADIELQKDLQDLEPGEIPQPEESHNVLKFLKDSVLDSPDRFKTANLTGEELGKPSFSTRFWLNLANTCENLFSYKIVGEYCRKKAVITTDTSLSRDGFIISTSVTQRRVKEKKSDSELAKFLSKKSR